MSFKLKSFKDITSSESHYKKSFFQNLILGDQLASVLKLMELKKEFEADQIKIISHKSITKDSLLRDYQKTVGLWRGDELAYYLKDQYPNLEMKSFDALPLFYKEGKFHSFDGRARPQTLLESEDYFLQKKYNIELSELFESQDWEKLDEILNIYQQNKIIDKIEMRSSSDLVNRENWAILTKDFQELSCENLWVATSPKEIYQKISPREKFSTEFISYLGVAQAQSVVKVIFKLKEEIYSGQETLFIPQSFTHDWGHFIIEFNQDKETQAYECYALFFISEQDEDSDLLASKIKLLKRVLQRVFSQFESSLLSEYISVKENYFHSHLSQEKKETILFDYPQFHLLGSANADYPFL